MKNIAAALTDILDSPIAYHRSFVLLKVGVTGAVMLSQAIYWSKRTSDKNGWFYKSQEEWEEETGLTRYEQETARKKLVKAGIIEESRSGLPARLFYRVNKEALATLLIAAIEKTPSMRKSSKQDRRKATDKNAEKQQPGMQKTNTQDAVNPAIIHTEITTETTTDTLPGDGNPSPAAGGLPVVLSEQKQQGETETVFQDKCRATWKAYAAAYSIRYGVNPVRNAKVNTQVKQLVQRLGEEATPVAEFFVTNVNEAFVVRKYHDLGALVAGAETYRTQWATGKTMTSGQARQIDSTQTNANAADEAIRMFRAQQAKGGEQ